MSAIARTDVDEKKRRLLIVATGVAGAAAAGGVAVPFLASWFPSARALAAGAPVEVDISKMESGPADHQSNGAGKPVWVLRRTPEMIAKLEGHDALLVDPKSEGRATRPYIKGATRSIKPEVFVAEGVCTHLGCSPTLKKEIGAASDMGADWPAATTARATTRASTSPRASSRDRPRRRTCAFRPIAMRAIRRSSSAKTRREPDMAAIERPPVTGAGPFNGVLTWVDRRFPLVPLWKEHLAEYYAPKNFNFWYYFGSLAMLVLVIQIVSGIFLTMNYKPSAAEAFARSSTSCGTSPAAGSSATSTRPAPRPSSSACTCTWRAGSCTARTASPASSSGSSA
jgi:ubiquinol-cytochrome c reductase iron-sulfur subunit